MSVFYLNRNTKVSYAGKNEAVLYAIQRFYQDLDRTLNETDQKGSILHLEKVDADPEQFFFQNTGESDSLDFQASDELGVIYGLLYLSETYLGIQPFWFWNDQKFVKRDRVETEITTYSSMPRPIKYRGWFINDEVLLNQWHYQGDPEKTWEMALDALLRCGGNMVIPGTDKNSRKNRALAKKMGFFITHHHAEPLGAEMFARAYPALNPSFSEHGDLFRQLWQEGIKEQAEQKVVWNLGFRGQGDRPFWNDDPRYESDEARGKLISSIIKEQYDMVQAAVPGSPTCTNLYGEMMDLYQGGFLTLPKDVIKIWADNGYGCMVNRRIGNHNPRIPALPNPEEAAEGSQHGIYYHVSFYDLYTANHITMLPNPVDYVVKELSHAFDCGAKDYLIVNCSNIKPHVYYLDAIQKLWNGHAVSGATHSREYVGTYFSQESVPVMASLWEKYGHITVPFGNNEDEHAGEQFYTYFPRILLTELLKGNQENSVKSLLWATGDVGFPEQVEWFARRCGEGETRFAELLKDCEFVLHGLSNQEAQLFQDTLMLQVKVHLNCLHGCVEMGNAIKSFFLKEYEQAFYHAGLSAESYVQADAEMRAREHDDWNGYYANECLSDVKFTAYSLRAFMTYVRNIDDGPNYFQWMRELVYDTEDTKVILITHMENHMGDEEIFEVMKKKYEREE